MPKLISRRTFINTCCLTTIVPPAFAQKSAYKTNPVKSGQDKLKKLKPIDSHFVSVDGWILPAKTLTRGTV
jgi:hypothetical protein